CGYGRYDPVTRGVVQPHGALFWTEPARRRGFRGTVSALRRRGGDEAISGRADAAVRARAVPRGIRRDHPGEVQGADPVLPAYRPAGERGDRGDPPGVQGPVPAVLRPPGGHPGTGVILGERP